MDNQAKYNHIQKLYRAQYLQLVKDLEDDYGLLSKDLISRITKIFNKYTVNGILSKDPLEIIKREVNLEIAYYSRRIDDWLNKYLDKSIALSITGHDAASLAYMQALISQQQVSASIMKDVNSGKLPVLIRQQYGSGLDRLLRDQVWEKRWKDGFKLSDRIWFRTQESRKEIHGLIEYAINHGMNSIDFAHSLDRYLNNFPGPEWRIERLYPNGPRRGLVRYNCLRVARTETNQAYQKAQNFSAQNSILVKGIQWNLSGSHPKKDICDIYATQNIHGLGPGVYRAGETPTDHPNGLCFLTDVLYQGEELFSRIRAKYGIVA